MPADLLTKTLKSLRVTPDQGFTRSGSKLQNFRLIIDFTAHTGDRQST
jgi:hypothetical protein